MSVQMTIRVEDELAAFVDSQVKAGEGSRAAVINHALRQESRRRAAARDAQIYAGTTDPDLDSDAYTQWVQDNTAHLAAELD